MTALVIVLTILNFIAAALVGYSIHRKSYGFAAYIFTIGLFSHLLSIITLLSK